MLKTKTQITQSDLLDDVINGLRPADHNDLPAIRQALNNAIDHFHRQDLLSDRRSGSWSQAAMVRKVRAALRSVDQYRRLK